MIRRRHHSSKKRLKQHIEELDRLNRAEEKQIYAEVAQYKKSHIKRYGKPTPVSKIQLKGLALDKDQ